MMGMVLVACFAARLVTKFSLTRASTLGCTSLPTGLAPSPSSPRGRETQPEYFCLQYNQTPMVLAGMPRFAFREYWGRRDPRQILFSVLSSSAAPRLDRFPPRQSQISTRTVFMRQFLPLFEMLCPESLGQNVRYSIRSGVILSRSFSGVSPAELRSLAQDVGRYEPHPVHGCVAALLHVGGPFVGPA